MKWQRKCRERGIPVELSVAIDDISSAPREKRQSRRGIAGIFFAYKIAGALADLGANLNEVRGIADRVIQETGTVGVALTSCTIPAAGKPTFVIGEDEMEFGMGIHGEPGFQRTKLLKAKEIAETITERIIADLSIKSEHKVAVLINGLGATPAEELYILYKEVYEMLGRHNIKIARTFVGEYATSMEMAGASVSLLRLNDEFEKMLNAPAFSPFLQQWDSNERL